LQSYNLLLSQVCLGGKVPQSYYLKNRETRHLKKLIVNKGQTERIAINIKDPNSLVK